MRVFAESILRTQQGGGEFVAPLAVDVRMTFIPVKPARYKARTLELEESFTFPATPIPWRLAEEATAKKIGPVFVDTNGDLTPDTLLPGTSNFAPGLLPNRAMTESGGCGLTCHADTEGGKQHCYTNPPPPWCVEGPIE